MIKAVLGLPPWTAVLLAVVMTAVGVAVDLFRVGTVGAVFEIAYGVGCVVAVAWVRRRSLFLPAIQPPLLLAVVVPLLAVLIGAPSESAGLTEHLLLAGAPLINAFPAMAVTTVLVLLVAGFRLVRQRTGPDDAVGLLRARLSRRGAGRSDDGRVPDDDRAADRATADRATSRPRGRGDRGGDRAASRGGDRGSERPATRTTGRPSARTADRASADAPERSGRPARRRSPAAAADARDRGDRAGGASRSGDERTRTGRGRAGDTRSSRSDGPAEPTRGDDRSSDPGRRGGLSGTGRSGADRRVRRSGSGPSSANGGRTRRPRPSDPA